MARTCTFTRDATSVTVRAPRYPEPGGQEPTQLIGRTWSGRFVVCDLGAAGGPRHELTLEFANLTRTEWNALRGFIVTTCGWASGTFTYTDPWGGVHANMRYVSGVPEAHSSKGDRWALALRIARDMEA